MLQAIAEQIEIPIKEWVKEVDEDLEEGEALLVPQLEANLQIPPLKKKDRSSYYEQCIKIVDTSQVIIIYLILLQFIKLN